MDETMILAERDLKLNKTMMEMRNEQVRLLTRMKQVGGRRKKNKYLNDVYEIYNARIRRLACNDRIIQ